MEDFNQTRSFNLGIAQATSVEAALIYDSFAYLQKRNGDDWFYHSYDQLLQFLPVMSESTARRAIKQLVDEGWVEKKTAKVKGAPIAHYRILKSVSVKMTDSESAKMTETKDSVKMTETIKRNTTLDTTIKSKKSEVEPLFNTLTTCLKQPTARLLPGRQQKLAARLRAFEPADLIKAAKNLAKDDWMNGKNDRGKKYGTIDYLLRSDEQVEHWMNEENVIQEAPIF